MAALFLGRGAPKGISPAPLARHALPFQKIVPAFASFETLLGLRTTVANRLELGESVGPSEQGGTAGEEVPLKVGPESVAKHRDLQIVGDPSCRRRETNGTTPLAALPEGFVPLARGRLFEPGQPLVQSAHIHAADLPSAD